MRKIILVGIIFVFALASNGFSGDVTNQQILEKLDKLETKINSMDVSIARLETKVEEGQKSLQKQIDEIKGFMLWIAGVLFAGMFALMGFVLWDRRTALAPAVRKMEALEKREESLERVLKEFAMKEPRLTEALKYAGIL